MNQEIREGIRVLAGEELSNFEREYWTVEGGAPEWVRKLAFAAHDKGGILLEDFRYIFIVEALKALAEDPEKPDLKPDIYISQLLKWLGDYPSYRIRLVDEAVSELGWSGLFNALQAGQLREKEEVLGHVREFLEKKIEEGKED